MKSLPLCMALFGASALIAASINYANLDNPNAWEAFSATTMLAFWSLITGTSLHDYLTKERR